MNDEDVQPPSDDLLERAVDWLQDNRERLPDELAEALIDLWIDHQHPPDP